MLRHQGEGDLLEGSSAVSGRQAWVAEVLPTQGWELRLVLDTRPAVYKNHLEFVLQAAANHKKSF